MSYVAIEAAARNAILAAFPTLLTTDTCQAGNIDAIVDAMWNADSNYGCLIDYNDGNDRAGAPFKDQMWEWEIMGIFFVRLSDTIEDDFRNIVTILKNSIKGDHTLGQTSTYARMTSVGKPEAAQINDVPYYFIPFLIVAWEK